MKGKTLQLPILLAGLVLIHLARLSSATYKLDDSDDRIASMNVIVDKGISYISLDQLEKEYDDLQIEFVFVS